MKWSEAVTLQFVKIYLKHELLWNPEHLLYRSRDHRDLAYTEISSEFRKATMKSLTVSEVKIKIRNLRTTYGQQIQKILQKSNPDCIYEPSLIWFHEMDRCLKNIPSNRHSYPTCQEIPEIPEVDSSCQIWMDQEAENNKSEEVNSDPLISPSDDNYDSPTEDSNQIKNDIPVSQKKIKKKKLKHRPPEHDYSKTPNLNVTILEDEFDIYGKYIASQLRKMDLEKALRIQLEIQSLVSEARISNIHSD